MKIFQIIKKTNLVTGLFLLAISSLAQNLPLMQPGIPQGNSWFSQQGKSLDNE